MCLRLPIATLTLAFAAATVSSAQMPEVHRVSFQGDFKQLLRGPQGDVAGWMDVLQSWRLQQRAALALSRADYDDPALRWTRSSFIQPLVMAEDRFLYDPVAGRYTVDRYLNDLKKRYGGIDCVLIWPTYPNIGIDNRNQHDLLRAMPGGLEGLRGMVSDFHRRGVRVIFPIMPWDKGTRDEGVPIYDALAHSIKAIGADAMNGDTLFGIPREFRDAAESVGHLVAFEPELGVSDDKMLNWNTMSWGYWWPYEQAPGVDRYKWLQPSHMTHVCDRWLHDRTEPLQYAFFNGSGYVTWENIWSIWNGLTPRDAEVVRRISAIYRTFPDLVASADWEPFTPMLQPGVYASKFSNQDLSLWTIVNRTDRLLMGQQISLANRTKGPLYYDLWTGVELKPAGNGLELSVEAHGYGAVLEVRGKNPQGLAALLKQRGPLSTLSHDWKPLPQKLAEVRPTKRFAEPPEGMIRIPGAEFRFKVTGIETEQSEGVDVQYPWEDAPRLAHDHVVSIKPFFIDRYPVTNRQFKQFMVSTHYRPRDTHNFLNDWTNGTFPAGWENKPVTWVSLEDARAYAKWAGKRLPHEWEWQYAAQGADGRLYPWGNDWNAEAVPPTDKGRSMREPTNVDAFPAGASPFGVVDLVGNVWQWTDEVIDEHTRSGILKGGSYYQPQGSHWYFPQAYRLDQHGKYLLLSPGKDRAGTVGFRCVADAR